LRKKSGMTKNGKWTLGAAAVVAVAAIAIIFVNHAGDRTTNGPRAQAELIAPQISDGAIADAIRQANVDVERLSVRSASGIVVLRGNADPATSAKAVSVVKNLGFKRVANLIGTSAAIDDEGIRRNAERRLASARGLDGCTLRVSCTRGVLLVEGTTHNELQVDLARTVLRTVQGAHEVRVALQPAI